ncbi:unnamed protein product [Parajaminaea phylloscopi]
MLVIFALLALASSLAVADHFDCHWQPTGGNVPSPGSDWTRLCQASASGEEYRCPDPNGHPGPVVASYQGSLHIATPCGAGGYGFSKYHKTCFSDSWLACAQIGSGTTCYGLDKSDDCQWPPSDKPASVTIYWEAK